MRGRLSFALTACTLLFTIEGLAVVLASALVLHSTAASGAPAVLLLLLLPLAALAAPALQLGRLGRYNAVAGTAIIAAVGRALLVSPTAELRLIAGSIMLAAGTAFLSSAVGFLERRSVAAGVGAAVVLDQILRLAGWSWSISMRPWWLLPQLLVTSAVILLAVLWLRMPEPAPEQESSFERRAGGLRLRGGLALALLLFIDINVLARAEVASRLLLVRYEAASVVLVSVGAAAVLILLAGQGPLGRYRPWSAFLAATTALAAAGVWFSSGWFGVLLMAAGHASAILLIGRALVPSSGRRKGGTMTAAAAVLVALNVAYSVAFARAGRPVLVALLAGAGLVLVAAVVLMPRPLATHPPLRRRLYAALAGVAAVSIAGLLAVRERPERPDEPAGPRLQVAVLLHTWGFAEGGRYDPGLLVAELSRNPPDVLVLEQAASAMPAAYGTDLGLYLGRRVGFRVHFTPGPHPLLGSAVLTRVETALWADLPGALDAARLAARVATADDVELRTVPGSGYTLRTATLPSPAHDVR
jgi:hypothetical protein